MDELYRSPLYAPLENESTRGLDTFSRRTEKIVSDLGLPGGPSDIRSNLRADCIRSLNSGGGNTNRLG
jgi:hypothetical protein